MTAILAEVAPTTINAYINHERAEQEVVATDLKEPEALKTPIQ